ncbi:hypothetical protein niasHS_004306 [Heterodera schachtii]|uniref:BTB domain-containing protein n=1 Tax=Heterodera schachtii TaxID=97005 RepID=A0ABD2JVD6_HETSC
MPSLGNSMERMKHLLSTAEHSDVHFMILPAHQLILKNASDVFEAMFNSDAKKEKAENVSANCPVAMEVPDVEAAAFEVMLSFIYTEDVGELNGDNAMAVFFAAKKYNILAWLTEFCKLPSPNCTCFLGFHSGSPFRIGDNFLQIDQEILCVLLDNDRLLLSDEFEIWNAAIRWADEKCRQNGIECYDENRHEMLGSALFKIRFPNIQEADFAKCIVPSDVLTGEELLGIYQFNSHPFLYLRGVPGLYSLKFPSHGRIFSWNKAMGNRRGTLALEIEKVSEFAGESVGSNRFSDAVSIKGLAWKIEAQITEKTEGTDEKKLVVKRLHGVQRCVINAREKRGDNFELFVEGTNFKELLRLTEINGWRTNESTQGNIPHCDSENAWLQKSDFELERRMDPAQWTAGVHPGADEAPYGAGSREKVAELKAVGHSTGWEEDEKDWRRVAKKLAVTSARWTLIEGAREKRAFVRRLEGWAMRTAEEELNAECFAAL